MLHRPPEPAAPKPRPAWRWRFDKTCFDEASLLLTIDNQPVELERRPLDLLALLLAHAGEVVTKEEILDSIWPAREVTEASLTKCVARLRQALGDTDHAIVRTVHGYGYRFAAKVTVEETTGAPAPPPASSGFAPGDPVPHRRNWRLVERLGTGGYGDAWLGEQPLTHERRVFKFANDAAGLAALRREVTLGRLLREGLGPRPDLIRILDWNFEEPPAFIETAWSELGNLAGWAASEGGAASLPLELRLDLAAQIAEALSAIHGMAVLHKDLKPANVLMRRDEAGRPAIILTDFGSGRALEMDRLDAFGITRPVLEITVEDSTAGTAMYRAPELSAGGAPTVQADIFAAGVMLFQLAAGDLRRPLAPGWEEHIPDPLLREDIGLAAAGDPARRLADAAELARRLRTLPARRQALARAEAAAAETIRTRRALELARARRTPLLALLGVSLLGFAVATSLYVRADRANTRAQLQAQRANAVTGFLTDDLFSAANPLLAADPNIPVKKVLAASAADLHHRFPAGSLDRAAIEAAIGGAYAGLADADHALPLLQASLAARREKLGDADPQTQAVRLTIADLAERTGNPDALRDAGNAVLAAHPTDAETELHGQYAVLFADCVTTENDSVCVAKLRPFLAELRDRLGPRHPLTLRAQDLLAYQLSQGQHFDEAVSLARETVSLTQAAYGPDHLLVQDRRLHLGEVLIEAGQPAEAIAILQDVRRRLLTMSGSETDMTARVATQLGRAYGAAKRYDEGLAALRTALDYNIKAHGETFEFTRDDMNLVAKMLAAAGRPLEGIPLGEKALALQRQARGADHEESLWIEANLAEEYRQAGNPARAEALYRDIVTRSRRVFTHGEWDLGYFEDLLGELLAEEGKVDEARPVLTESTAVLTRNLGAANPRTQRAVGALAGLKH
jgi:non-specific serine/threonine protein kinase